MKTMRWFKGFLTGCLLAAGGLGTASGQPPMTSPLGESAPGSGTLLSLEALQRALVLKEAEAAAMQGELAAAPDDMLRQDVGRRLQEIRNAIEEQRRQFDGFAMDIDLRPFSPQKDTKFDWQEEVGKLLKPILAEFEHATAESRAIGQLRQQIEDVRTRRDLAAKAVANLESLLAQPASPELRNRLEGRLKFWKGLRDQLDNEYSALDLQLKGREATRASVLDQTTGYAKTFFRTRGLNLLLGVVAFCVVFFGFRLGERAARKLRRKGTEKKFSSRLTALLFHVFSVLGGLAAMMLVFNMAGDWFLLGIVIIFLFGVGWASINTLPQQVETIKLMLNIGAVREGEFLVFEGTPYRVESLGFSAHLKNPRLDGGTRLLPVKFLVGMNSRPVGAQEAWFPCETGDWVALAGGQIGKIVSQTPASVQLAAPGGEQIAYPTAAFLGLQPKNLSAGFRVDSTFGIDYRHQTAATTEIPEKMRAKLQAELPRTVGAENIRNIQVVFSSATGSSLDFTIWVDLKGAAAPLGAMVRGAIQRILVESCSENDWIIPFPQIQVHQD
jgi:small-conductance mechanosensitive channel